MLERKAWFPKHGFFFFSWLKLSKSLAHLVRVTTLKKLSFVCPKTSSSEACFLRMSEPPLSQCQQMNLGDLRFSISFCLTEPIFKRCIVIFESLRKSLIKGQDRTKNSTHFCVFQPNRVIFRKFQKFKSSSIEGFNFSWEFGGIISDSSL